MYSGSLQVRYRELIPPAWLRDAVECVWILDGENGDAAPAFQKVVPDGCAELIVHVAEPFRAVTPNGHASPQPSSLLVGPLTRPLRLEPPRRVGTVGIRFRPAGASRFVPQPLSDLTDAWAPLDAVIGRPAKELEESLAEARTDGEILSCAVGFLSERSARAAPDPPLEHAVREILARRGNVTVERLAKVCGLAPRRLERRFRARTGLSPKRLSRIARFQSVLAAVEGRSRAAWLPVALDCGYFDRSHLIREFREMSEETPPAFLASEGELSRHFTAPRRLARFFAAG